MSRASVFISRDRLAPTVRDKEQADTAAKTLAQLAQHVLDRGDEARPESFIAAVVRSQCPHITSGTERMRLWREYLAAVKQEAAILDGLIGWSDIDPELNGLDRTQDAIDIAVEMSKQALEALCGGAG